MEKTAHSRESSWLTPEVIAGISLGGVTEVVSIASHGGILGALVGVGAGLGAVKFAPHVREVYHDLVPASVRSRIRPYLPGQAGEPESNADRYEEEDDDEIEPLQPRPRDFDASDELIAPRRARRGMFLFSQVLANFTPSLNRIYLGTLETGEMVFCRAEELCHVALAGTTRAGKSSIMRMLAAQLCYAGASVLLLNPHHSRYIYEKREDWTPFEGGDASGHPYLLYPPMECRQYDVIEHYLRQVVEIKLAERRERVAHGRPAGKPFFLVLDELPAIVKHVPAATSYLDELIRQGAKYNLFVVSASQDFLVKTLKLESGEARECYRTAYYVGGGAQTAKILLDTSVPATTEEMLGQGTVLLRNWQAVKHASVAFVPYVDNESLYRLLGPSTYTPEADRQGEEDLDEPTTEEVESAPARHHYTTSSYEVYRKRMAARPTPVYVRQPEQAFSEDVQSGQRIPTLQEVRAAFPNGKPSKRDIRKRFDLTDYQAYKLYGQL